MTFGKNRGVNIPEGGSTIYIDGFEIEVNQRFKTVLIPAKITCLIMWPDYHRVIHFRILRPVIEMEA